MPPAQLALAQISHELRTPLTGLLGLLEMLGRTSLDEAQRAHLDAARRAGETLLRLITDLLDSSGLALGRLKIRSLPFDPAALLAETMEMLAPLAKEKGIHLSAQVEISPGAMFQGDPYRIRQVLTNLVHNAVKFTAQGAIRVGLRLQELSSDPVLLFSVEDTGAGMDAQKVQKILSGGGGEAEGDSRRLPNGSGLGLSICRQLVQRMGGELSIRSVPGRGSVFQFTVPKTSAPRENGRAEPLSQPRPDQAAPLVLVVEDNPENCSVAVAILERLGCRADVARNGQEAVQKVSRQRYDLVLMDWQMSAMDGPSATRAIRKREGQEGGRVPIVAMTANVMQEQRQACLQAGMDDFVAKPYTLSDLESVLRRWLAPAREKPRSE